MNDKAQDHPCSACGKQAIQWIPESTVQDDVEIIDHIKRQRFHIDYKAYCKTCAENWRKAKIK